MITYFPDLDYFIIGGDKSPGIARLTKADSPSGIDVRKGYGLSGATTVPTGEEPSDVEFTIELWDEGIPTKQDPLQFLAGTSINARSHPQQWDAFARKWLTRPVFQPGTFLSQSALAALALPIVHPGLNRAPINITKVLRHNCTALVNDGTGLWTCTVSFLQFKPPRLALPKPTTALPNKPNPRPTAMNANQRAMQANQATIDQLAGE